MAECVMHPRASPCVPVRATHKHTVVDLAVLTSVSGHSAGVVTFAGFCLAMIPERIFLNLKIMQTLF